MYEITKNKSMLMQGDVCTVLQSINRSGCQFEILMFGSAEHNCTHRHSQEINQVGVYGNQNPKSTSTPKNSLLVVNYQIPKNFFFCY